MADRTYPRPDVALDELLDALYEAGADQGVVGTGDPALIGISISGADEADVDAIWGRAMLSPGAGLPLDLRGIEDGQFRRAFSRARGRVSQTVPLAIEDDNF